MQTTSWFVRGWASGFGWWLVLLACSLAALPLVLRTFRGLPDRGVGFAPAAGVSLLTLLSWYLSLDWFTGRPGAAKARLILLAGAVLLAAIAYLRKSPAGCTPRQRLAHFHPALLLGVLSLIHVPFMMSSVLMALVLVAGCSVAAWAGEWRGLLRTLRQNAVPILVTQALLLGGFVFFLNVRSYIPYATFDTGMSAAEKFGNLAHLSSNMSARSLPPSDVWFNGEPDNYYYGGHLTVATLAKLSGTPTNFAFNFGLATVFGTSLAGAFSFVYGLVHAFPARRRSRFGIAWHRGMGWGLVGALAIVCFGNLDAWQQIFTHQPEAFRAAVEERLAKETPPGTAPEKPGNLEVLLSRESLLSIDYWRSSRAFKSSPPGDRTPGTITEFPYFSAILGDLHPHHMAIPNALILLGACVSLLRKGARFRGSDADWFRRCWPEVVAMGIAMGSVFTVNIWDAVVGAPLTLLVVLLAFRRAECHPAWRLVGITGMYIVNTMVISFLLNSHPKPLLLFGRPVFWALSVLLVAGCSLLVQWRPRGLRETWVVGAGLLVGSVLLFAGGASTAAAAEVMAKETQDKRELLAPALAGIREVAAGALALWLAMLWCWFDATPRRRWWFAAGTLYAVVGVTALYISTPFRQFFTSPLEPGGKIFESVVPLRMSEELMAVRADFWGEFWKRSPVNPFPPDLRTDLRDLLVHFGLFLVPVWIFLLVRMGSLTRRWDGGRSFALWGVTAGVYCFAFDYMGKHAGPLGITCCVLSILLSVVLSRRREGAAWVLLAVAFFEIWFVEALHFDDNYTGTYERYNTPFKILYPVWAMLAGGMIMALHGMLPRVRLPATGSRIERAMKLLTHAGMAALLLGAVLVLGLLYPAASTAGRTRWFFHAPLPFYQKEPGFAERATYTQRTLDASLYMSNKPEFANDYKMIQWIRANMPAGSRILEISGDVYSPVGRIAANTGSITVLGWTHHERQWRGWEKPVSQAMRLKYVKRAEPGHLGLTNIIDRYFAGKAPADPSIMELKKIAVAAPADRPALLEKAYPSMAPDRRAALAGDLADPAVGRLKMTDVIGYMEADVTRIYQSPDPLDESVKDLLRLYDIRNIFVGSLETKKIPQEGLRKFTSWKVLHQEGDCVLYQVPDSILAEKGGSK